MLIRGLQHRGCHWFLHDWLIQCNVQVLYNVQAMYNVQTPVSAGVLDPTVDI